MTIYIRKHTIFPEEFPESWASDWGEDEFGLWMAFTYKGVRKAFRWCEPGTFLMGSLEDESEREDDELLHQVTLIQGFWIADTAVTQGLWKVIMGNNPSIFIGDENPVETVSWEDAQAFIAKMNGMKAELKLCLLAEAQWEYACRAGTTTPFSWGDQIDTSLVNFEGRRPYNNGRESEYRRQTIAVKALPCNGWGLYQMHGNVWNGVWIGSVIIRRNRSSIRKGRKRATAAWCAAARGSTVASTAVLLAATAAIRPFAPAVCPVTTTPLAFALPEVNELKPSQVKAVEQTSSRLAAARLIMVEHMGDRWGMLRVFMLHKLVILSRPLYNPCITTNLIFLDERCKCT